MMPLFSPKNIHIQCTFLSLNEVTQCQDALGMKNMTITDSQLSASSHEGGGHTATSARLNGDSAWRAGNDDVNPWIRVDFDQLTYVSGIATQGRPDRNNKQWVTKYRVHYNITDEGKILKDCDENEVSIIKKLYT